MADSDNDSGGYHKSLREQDRLLPIANVGRIMKKALPGNAKISKDAKETVQECVSEFISFVTGEASDKCQKEKRKTINGDDLLWAMATLGFEDYVDPLKVYLQRFREMEGERNTVARDRDAGAAGNSEFLDRGAGAGAGASEFRSGMGLGMMTTMAQQQPQHSHYQPHVYGSNGPRWDGPGYTPCRPR